jgi:energy-converting hydrogenase Eha subunit G
MPMEESNGCHRRIAEFNWQDWTGLQGLTTVDWQIRMWDYGIMGLSTFYYSSAVRWFRSISLILVVSE